MTRNELEAAIQASLDGTLSEAQCLELRAVLKSDPAARALYYEYADLHQSLIFRISRITPFDSARSLADIRLHLQRRRTTRMAVAIAAAAVVMLGIGLKLGHVTTPALATYRPASGSLFTIQSTAGRSPAGGEIKDAAWIDLTQGTFEFTLRNGTRGIVLAPAEFELRSETEMILNRGTAWFEVSEEGKGFRVATSELIATDLGTEFGIIADPGAPHEVHVFSGLVQARTPQGSVAQLTAGQGRRRGHQGLLEAIPAKSGNFLKRLPEESTSNLLANGGFEAGSGPDDSKFGVKANAALLPGWQFGGDVSIALRSANGTLGFGSGWSNLVSPTGDVQVSFSNTTPHHEVGTRDDSIWQTFPTTPGHAYEVSFDMGAYFVTGKRGDVSVTATIHDGSAPSGSQLGRKSSRRAGDRNSDNGYNPRTSFTFTALSPETTLVLTETSANSDLASPVIDNIAVRPVPAN